MLNIGKLRADAVDYYVGSVAPTAADYYFGRGESPGRWTGSLAPELGLEGRVEREAIEALLGGLDPRTGAELVSSSGSNARARARSQDRAALRRAGAQGLDVAQVAAQLQVSTRAVRHWLEAGEVAKDLLRAATPAATVLQTTADYEARLDELTAEGVAPEGLPTTFLLGQRSSEPCRGGHRYRWAIAQASVDRVRDQRRPPDARAGWDLVFRPPKSYSVLWAVGPERLRRELQAVHHEATADALSYLEDTAATARSTADVGRGRKRVRTASEGLVVAAFDHRDSRAGDPLLHTHCVVANVTRLGDGTWAALDPHGLYRQGLAADAVYQASFRHLAERRLGLCSEPVLNGWADVEGVPRSVVEHFSKRSQEIAAELARVGSDSAAARQIAAVASRRAKATDRAADGLHERWRTEAAALGFDDAAVAACLHRTTGAEVDDARLEALFDRLGGPGGLTEEAATFSRAGVVCALSSALGGAVPGSQLAALADRFLASDRVVQVREHRPGLPRHRLLDAATGAFVDDLANAAFTTPELAAIEARLMALANATATATDSARRPMAPTEVVESTLATRPLLSDEQRAMVRAVCGSSETLRPVVGYPGSGKTYATEACVAALAAAGVPVVGCAVTAVAADELARATGLGACDTVAHTLADLDHPEFGGLAPGSVVIADEASTLSHRDLDRLVAHVEAAGGALVLVGDPRQHGAVGPGHFFAWLVGREGADVPTLRANHRQADVVDATGAVVVSLAPEREANTAFREGRIAEALALRDDAGLVTRTATAPELYDAVVTDWLADWRAGRRDPMVTTRNAVRHQLNLRARRLLDEAGELTGPALEVGDRVFRAGDYVVARANNRRLRSTDGSWWVKNGNRGTVAAVDAEAHSVTVDFEGAGGASHRVALPSGYLTEGLEWAYAVTDYGVQARTLDRSRAVVDDTTTAAGAYVATTRGRLENRLYLVDGTVAEERDLDASHGPPALRESSFDALAARLAADVPDGLVHEADPAVADGGLLAATHRLSELHALLEPVAAVVAAAPPDVSRRIAGAESAYETHEARRRVLAARLAGTEAQEGSPRGGGRRSRGAEHAELDGIARSLDALGGRLLVLRAQAARREAYLASHADDVARRDLLRDAIAGRETKVRLAAPALVPAEVKAALPEPSARADADVRQRWRRAIEQVALYVDRWGEPWGTGGNGGPIRPTGVWPDHGHGAEDEGQSTTPAVPGLGRRPAYPEAASAWDEAARAVVEAGGAPDVVIRPTTDPEPDLSPAL